MIKLAPTAPFSYIQIIYIKRHKMSGFIHLCYIIATSNFFFVYYGKVKNVKFKSFQITKLLLLICFRNLGRILNEVLEPHAVQSYGQSKKVD
jgi:hypothetical protein